MNEEHAQRHALMVSQEAGEGAPGSAIIWYLDWLDDQGVPQSEHLDDQYLSLIHISEPTRPY